MEGGKGVVWGEVQSEQNGEYHETDGYEMDSAAIPKK